jgi:hypothetical protein
MKLVLAFVLAGCFDDSPVDPMGRMSYAELATLVSPQTTCGTLCAVGDDQFCRDECGNAICQAARCDNCGGICIFLTAIP